MPADNIHVIIQYGVCVMFNDLKNEGIIVDLKNLVDKAEEFQNEVDSYCQFMLETFLNTSGVN